MWDWFESLGGRDRKAVILGGLAVLLAGVWLLLIEPLNKRLTVAGHRLEAAEVTFDRVAGIRDRVMRLGGIPARDEVDPVKRAESILSTGFDTGSPLELREAGEDTLQLQSAGISHRALVDVLVAMRDEGLFVDRLDVRRAEQSSALIFDATLHAE